MAGRVSNRSFGSSGAAGDGVRLPPHSIEAEQSVLGGLMLDAAAWDQVADRVLAEDFYRNDHRLIFEAVAGLIEYAFRVQREIKTMADAKLAPNLPGWMVDHANRYLSSGGTEGHMYKMTQPGRPEMTVPSLLLTTTGRKSGDKYMFPLFYGKTGDSYIVVASKGGAPEHPGWYRNILANPDVEVQVGPAKMKARARTATGEERARLWEKSLEFWPPYADYQRKTEREIPVVVLDPVR